MATEEEINAFNITKAKLLKRIDFEPVPINSKITIVGYSRIGMACAMCILMDDTVRNLCFFDPDKSKNKEIFSELSDLQHASYFSKSVTITGGQDYALTAKSDIVVITIQEIDESPEATNLSLAQLNANVFFNVIPKLMQYSLNPVLMVVTEPNNIMTYVAWRMSKLPKHKVIGVGPSVDSAKFRFLISEKLGASPKTIRGWIIGDKCENGGIPIWSSFGIAGASLKDIFPYMGSTNDENEEWYLIPETIKKHNSEIRKFKKECNWSTGFTVTRICRSILRNTMEVISIACHVNGYMGIEADVFLGLPCMIGSMGVMNVIQQKLNENEIKQLQDLARKTFDLQINLILIKSCD